MSIENINQAAGAMNALTARMNGFVNNADAQIEQRRAAYDGIAADLKGTINTHMYFTGYVRPDEPNPTLVDGGTFNTIKQCIDAAPCGAMVFVLLEKGKIHLVGDNISVYNRNIEIDDFGTGERPVIEFGLYHDENYNWVSRFFVEGTGSIRFRDVELRLPTEKGNPDAPWSASKSAVHYNTASSVTAGINNCLVTGAEGLGFASCNGGCTAIVSAYNSQLSGNIFLVVSKGGGAAVISKISLTLSNGALLYNSDGVVGTNVIQNEA